jgi:hypothetical protein
MRSTFYPRLVLLLMLLGMSACRSAPPVTPTALPTPRPSPTPLPFATEVPVEIAVDVTSGEVGVGETTEVAVWVWRVGNLYGAEVHLWFDPALLEVVDTLSGDRSTQIEHGDLLAADYVVQNSVNNDAGTIDYAVSQMHPSHGVSGSGRLATIRFRAKATGVAEVRIEQALLANTEGAVIPVSLDGATSLVIKETSSSKAGY